MFRGGEDLDALAPLLLNIWTRLMARLPFRATVVVGNFIGQIGWLFGTRPAKVTRANLKHCFPALREAEIDRLAKASLCHTGRLLAEAGITFHWSQDRLDSLYKEVEGASLLESSLAIKKGVLLLAPHFGNWEMIALYIGRYGFTALYDPPRVASLDAQIRETRERTGGSLAPIDGQGLRAVFQALKSGRLTALLPDQVPAPSAGIYAPFFGRPALTMTFAHRLIQSTKPLVLLCSCRRVRDGFKLIFEQVDEAVYSEDQLVSVTAMNRAIETLVRKDPAQYQWEYKRFKRLPAGATRLYAD